MNEKNANPMPFFLGFYFGTFNRIQVRISIISISQDTYRNGELSLEHNFPTRLMSLGEIGKILALYDELNKKIEGENKP